MRKRRRGKRYKIVSLNIMPRRSAHLGKRYKVVNKFKFVRSITVLLIILIAIIALITSIVNKVTGTTEEEKVAESMPQNKSENITQEESENITQEVTANGVEAIDNTEEENKIQTLIDSIKQTNNLNEENFAFFYQNVDTGASYFFNENKFFTAASTVKVPLSMLYYDKIRKGDLTEDSTLKYKEDDYEAGSGTTDYTYSVGDSIPISFLMEQSIINSDNTATNILIDGIGKEEYRRQIAQYSGRDLPDDFFSSNITSAGYSHDVIEYLAEHQSDYTKLIEDMKKSSSGEYLKAQIPDYEVAHKYGDYEGNIHDYGIIYGKNTYLIGVFTSGVPNAKALIEDIGKRVVDTVESE